MGVSVESCPSRARIAGRSAELGASQAPGERRRRASEPAPVEHHEADSFLDRREQRRLGIRLESDLPAGPLEGHADSAESIGIGGDDRP